MLDSWCFTITLYLAEANVSFFHKEGWNFESFRMPFSTAFLEQDEVGAKIAGHQMEVVNQCQCTGIGGAEQSPP